MMRSRLRSMGLCLTLFVIVAETSRAESTYRNPFEEASLEQKLGEQVPLDAEFKNSQGRTVALRDLIQDRPVILTPVYIECPMLCSMTMDGLLRALRVLDLDLGDQYDIITFSFNSAETPREAAAKKQTVLRKFDDPDVEGHWHFLTGDQATIDRVTDSIGFEYAYDPKTRQYLHAACILILTPEGKISRYLLGVEFSARDIRLALVEASAGKISSLKDNILLLCYEYDPSKGKYGLIIFTGVRAAGLGMVLVLIGLVAYFLLRERRAARLQTVDGLALAADDRPPDKH